MKLRSPLSKAVGSGSAKHGFSHWWWQRLSAIALIPLVIWFVWSLLCLINSDYQHAILWLQSPINATLLLLFICIGLYHAQTGLQVVIEDYVHSKWLHLCLLLITKFAALIMAVLAIISVLKVIGS